MRKRCGEQMDVESASSSSNSMNSYWTTLLLAYQSFGVVYGDLCISPIYVFRSTFSGNLRLHEDEEEIFGVFSLIFWTLTLIPLVKYIFFVLEASDDGEGGTFALYSLMCRHSKMGLLDSDQSSYDQLLCHGSEMSAPKERKSSLLIKNFFEKHQSSRAILLLVVLLGTGMVIGDGILTPTMSVLSAVSGIRVKAPQLHENYTVFIACLIIIGLFTLQHYGTHRVGSLFAPILIAWLLCITGIGIYNIIKWNHAVIGALSPHYAYNFFKRCKKDAWSSLGGIVLCATGAEAMFADLGHFSKMSVRIAFIGVVYPCLVVAYMGEAAYLSVHKEDIRRGFYSAIPGNQIRRGFYSAIPEHIFWPVFVIATLATVAGSQAIISATFSIISQCRALKCFPRVKIIHTSSKIHGQIYIPEVNWILMFLCLAVTIGFKDTKLIGNAYGLAVISVMFITTCLMFLIITTVWKQKLLIALAFTIAFGSFELFYLSACIIKVPHGGWLPILISLVILVVMSTWQYGTSKKESFEAQNKVSLDKLLHLSPSLGLIRIPGIGLVYSSIRNGVPPMLAHFVTNFPVFHHILIFVSVQSLTVPKVPAYNRFFISRIGEPQHHLYQCVVQYGYKDERRNSHEFENQLIMKVVEFLQQKGTGAMSISNNDDSPNGRLSDSVTDVSSSSHHTNATDTNKKTTFRHVGAEEEVKELLEARESGVAYMMGHTYVKAQDTSTFIKKFAINIVYGFLRKNCRHSAVELGIPHTSLIEVGMVYRV